MKFLLDRCLVITVLLTITFSVNAKSNSKSSSGGCLKATSLCEAYQSFRKKTNPGNAHLEKGELYPIIERSKKNSAFRIKIKSLKRSSRWVKASCGEVLTSCSLSAKKVKTISSKSPSKKKPKNNRKKNGKYLLALTWQPSFCETHGSKKECRTQTTNRYDATHWSLHGLWPQPRNNAYCGVSRTDKGIDRNKRWHLLEPLKLSQKTATELAFVMPAVASNLQRHEWIKHGTCYGTDAETYYSDSIYLTKQINDSIVGKLFNKGVGKHVTLKQVRKHFDKAFGKGTGKKVDMRCDRKGRVSELWINLKGEVNPDGKISELLKDALNAGSTCKAGLVDRANQF
ncbi:MAG TPA: ribonuclease T [Leucothrix sp.]|nr:ribonuclease T [Leucothrix sp.]